MSGGDFEGPLIDPKARAVLDRLHGPSARGGWYASAGRGGEGRGGGRSGMGRGGGRRGGEFSDRADPMSRAGRPLSIQAEQGDLIYLLCRAIGATRVVDFATSVGTSAIYFAAAVRDNGGGRVIGSEIVPEKVQTARANLTEAGLAEFVEVRQGDARETLRELGGPIDFALIDGFPVNEGASLARQVLDLITPSLRTGAMLLNDNGEADYLEVVRDPARGFRSLPLPIKGSTELSLKVE
jgi:predicted O-methyltransferase YrrM